MGQKENFGEEYVLIIASDFTEAEALQTALEGFKETVENRIQNYESTINNDIKLDWTATETQIQQDQHSRNRDIIKEIVAECANFREENRQKFLSWANEDEQDN